VVEVELSVAGMVVVGADVVESGEERLESFEVLQPADGLRDRSGFAGAGHNGTEDRVSIWRAGPIASPPQPGAISVPNTIAHHLAVYLLTEPTQHPLRFFTLSR